MECDGPSLPTHDREETRLAEQVRRQGRRDRAGAGAHGHEVHEQIVFAQHILDRRQRLVHELSEGRVLLASGEGAFRSLAFGQQTRCRLVYAARRQKLGRAGAQGQDLARQSLVIGVQLVRVGGEPHGFAVGESFPHRGRIGEGGHGFGCFQRVHGEGVQDVIGENARCFRDGAVARRANLAQGPFVQVLFKSRKGVGRPSISCFGQNTRPL